MDPEAPALGAPSWKPFCRSVPLWNMGSGGAAREERLVNDRRDRERDIKRAREKSPSPPFRERERRRSPPGKRRREDERDGGGRRPGGRR